MQIKSKAKITSVFKEKIFRTSAQPFHADNQMLLDADHIGIQLGNDVVLDDVSFCVHAGEFIGLIGPNGAGKTTLLRILLGLLSPTQGQLSKKPRNIGYVPQRGYTHENQVPLSVLEVVKLGSRGDITRANQALSDVNMQDAAHKRFTELSGGQQQRVLIAKALAGNPAILMLDEPTTGVDSNSQAEFFETLSRLHKKGLAVLMVSHDVDTVLRVVTRVICLNRSILYDGSPKHFEADKYLPRLYNHQHVLLHHRHGEGHA
jgi:zinc transport system ATP-binding protein